MEARKKPYELHVKNISLLPAFYMLPPEFVIGGCDFIESRDGYKRSYRHMPRNIYEVIGDKKWRSEVEDEAFAVYVLDALSYLLWPAFEERDRLNTFTDDYPLWRLVYLAAGQSIAELKTYGFTTENLLRFPRGQYVDYFSFETAQGLMLGIGVTLIQRNDWQPIIDCIQENRCFEDFNGTRSRDYISFFRSWYSTRSCEQVNFTERSVHHLQESSVHPDPYEPLIFREDFKRYLRIASSDDVVLMRLLYHRKQIGGQQGIAEKLGLNTHSAVSKRKKALNESLSEWFLLQPPEERRAQRDRYEAEAKRKHQERKRVIREEREKANLERMLRYDYSLKDERLLTEAMAQPDPETPKDGAQPILE